MSGTLFINKQKMNFVQENFIYFSQVGVKLIKQ